MFKRPKLNNYSKAGGGSLSGKRDEGGLSQPSFSRRSIKCPDLRSDDVMKRNKDTEQRNFKPERVTKPTSKWDAYLIDDEGEHQAARGALKDDSVGEWDRGVTDASSEYQVVDDEVHPDFM
ncbi:hypothetical protein F2Q69_00051420 [Brassica cretica]|nr:hypothetical protein F2Q69_00051420 [Brassica cretica]